MEMLNKIELIGKVGRVKIIPINKNRIASFSMMTEYAAATSGGNHVIETTWFHCTAFDNIVHDIDKLESGASVHVIGRLRLRKYIGEDCNERELNDVVVHKLDFVNNVARPGLE